MLPKLVELIFVLSFSLKFFVSSEIQKQVHVLHCSRHDGTVDDLNFFFHEYMNITAHSTTFH
jgi:hypothetical protein